MSAENREPASEAANVPQPQILWVDGVGGFLVLLGQRWTIGRYDNTHPPQIAVRGDLPRGAGTIQRRGSDYVLKPGTRLGPDHGNSSRPIPLVDGRAIDLGGSVRLGFARPHPLSASARLHLISRHRFEPACDGVILCADTCVLGPSPAAHIPCRHFTGDVVLFIAGNDLRIRCDRPFMVDGNWAAAKSVLRPGQRVEGDDFAMTLASVGNGNFCSPTG